MDVNQEEILLKRMKRHQLSKTGITDKSINRLKDELGWKGAGTESDPIIINDLSGLKPNLWFHRSSLHYIIRDIAIYKLTCISTQNITIENCKIHRLEVEGCYNMTIRNNSVLWLKFVYSKGCTLEDNSFSKLSLERLADNYFDKLYPMLQSGLYCASSLLIIVAFLIFAFSFYVWYLGLLTLGLVALLFYFVHTLKAKKKRTYEKPENIMVSISPLTDADINGILQEIIENYANLKGNWFRYNLPVFYGLAIATVVLIIIYTVIMPLF